MTGKPCYSARPVMEWLLYHFYSYGILLQAVAILHFIRRRPENYWLWVILLGGGLGALVYIGVEVVPDLGLVRGALAAHRHGLGKGGQFDLQVSHRAPTVSATAFGRAWPRRPIGTAPKIGPRRNPSGRS